ncbi:MAG TPA: hypothetical protein PLO43_02265 [Chlamydiales bacterium]|nr:hypothetical protein [Chlamydiales bacterium]
MIMHYILAFILMATSLFSNGTSFYQPSDTKGLKNCNYCGGPGLKSGFVGVAKMAKPAVVFLRVKGQPVDQYSGQNPYELFQDDFFNRFFGVQPQQQRPKQTVEKIVLE